MNALLIEKELDSASIIIIIEIILLALISLNYSVSSAKRLDISPMSVTVIQIGLDTVTGVTVEIAMIDLLGVAVPAEINSKAEAEAEIEISVNKISTPLLQK
jgi:hypothetical protein